MMRRYGLLALLLVLCWASPSEAAEPTLGSQTWAAATVSATVITLTNVDANSTIIVVHDKGTAGNRTMAITDADAASYGSPVVASATCTAAECIEFYVVHNHVANASLDITCTQGGGAFATYSCGAVEVNCAGGCATDTSSFLVDSTATNHVSSATANDIDTAVDVFITAACEADGLLGSETPGANYTALTETGTHFFWQYDTSASAKTDDRGAWTSGNSRICSSAILSVKDTPAAGSRPRIIGGEVF